MAIRLVDAGTVSALRSQTIYHGLAYARTDATPDTIVLATPGEPYVCIGFHQHLTREIDLEFCGQRGLAVLRRETGGGAVYLDRDQLFVQWVMGPTSLPARIEERFELFAAPLIATYRELGIQASFRPVNDVHVAGRKIVGTGAARIGSAEVVVGNFIFDFDTEMMARVLRTPSEAFRHQLRRGLRQYMTWTRRETGQVPDRDQVASIYRRKCQECLGREINPGELTGAELAAIDAVDRRFLSAEFLSGASLGDPLRVGGPEHRRVKIHEDVHVVESLHRTEGHLLRVTARVRENRIEEISLSEDPIPEDGKLVELEQALRGVELRRAPVTEAVAFYHEQRAAPGSFGAAPWVQAILNLHKHPEVS